MARVLLIDDDIELLEILGEWLHGKGHAVRTLSDPREAVPTSAEFRPDLILLDGLLRGTTGQAIARALEGDGAPRVVYLSGLPRNELPADRTVLQKPIDLLDLDRVIRELSPPDEPAGPARTA